MKKGRLIFNILSILFILSMFIIYGYRLVHFYKIEHMVYENSESKLYEVLINNKGIDGTDEGLQKKDNGYIYGSKSDNNYVYYAGRMWRIISIDENNNIKMITDEVQTILGWDKGEFEDSDIYKWLNKGEDEHSGIFEKSLKQEYDVSLLNISEYKELKENNYLISEFPYWIINENNEASYIDSKGEIITDTKNSVLGVRPTITISSDVVYVSGAGTESNPYIFTNNVFTTLKDAYVGEYVNYSNSSWRIIEVNDDKVKVALDGIIEEEQVFASKNQYVTSSGAGNYLNNTFYNNLENKDYIVQSDYYIGNYNDDYSNIYTKSVAANVGMYYVSEFFINEYGNVFTITPYARTSNTIYTINKNKRLYADYVTKKYNLRPTIYLDANLNILEGKGTKDFAYEVGK